MPKATATFEYDHAEHWGNGYFGFQDASGDFVAFVREDQSVTNRLKIAVRRQDKVVLYQAINTEDIILHERPGPGNITLRIIDANNELLDTLTLQGALDLLYRKPAPALVPPETVPPTKPPVLDEWVVVNSGGMNIRSTPQVTADDSNLVGEVPDGWTFNNDGIGATSTNYEWLHIYDGAFAGNWIAVERRSDEYKYCKLALEVEPPVTGTVQLTSADIQLVKRPDGYTRLTGLPPVGFNLRGAIHYAQPEWQDLTLDWMQQHGFNWVRTYVAREGVSLADCLNRTGVFVEKCAKRGIHVCLVVTDSLRDSGHIIDEMIPYHNGPQGHITLPFFMERRFTKDFFNWVDAVATEFGQDVSMIDLCNEPALYPQAGGGLTISQELTDAYVDCFSEAARIAYSASGGNVPITVGWINANHFRPANKDGLQHARETAQRMQYMQAYSFHVYAEPVAINPSYHPDALFRFEEDVHNMDFVAARETGKALLVGEYGSYESNADRARSIRNFRARNPEAEIMWYWQVCPLVQGQNKDIVVNTGDCDGHALVLGRDGEGEFWDCVEAAKS